MNVIFQRVRGEIDVDEEYHGAIFLKILIGVIKVILLSLHFMAYAVSQIAIFGAIIIKNYITSLFLHWPVVVSNFV